jgi:hypothetical protein
LHQVREPALGLFGARFQWRGADRQWLYVKPFRRRLVYFIRDYSYEINEATYEWLYGPWLGAESHVHGSRDDISAPPEAGGPEAGGNYEVEPAEDGAVPRLVNRAFRLMYMLSDIESGGGALRVVPGSHKRGVPWQPAGVRQREPSGNTRFDELSAAQQVMTSAPARSQW